MTFRAETNFVEVHAIVTDEKGAFVKDLKAPVLGLYAEQDQAISLNDVEAMRAALSAAGKSSSSIHVYPGTHHGFHADYREVYDEAAAKDGWARMKEHFSQNGLAP